MANFWYFLLELNAASVHVKPGNFLDRGVLKTFTELGHSKVKYKFVFYEVSSPPAVAVVIAKTP